MTATSRTIVIPTLARNWFSSPLFWPTTVVPRNLDFAVDFSLLVSEEPGDYLTEGSASIVPWGDGEAEITLVVMSGNTVVMWIDGGVAGRLYRVLVTVVSAQSRMWSFVVQLQISYDSALVLPPSPGYQTFSSTTVVSIDGMSLLWDNPLNSSNLALLF